MSFSLPSLDKLKKQNVLNSFLYRFGLRLISINTPLENAFRAQEHLVRFPSITIFDIGAHFGETSLRYNKTFPSAYIYSFEPFLPSFEILKNSVKSFPNIKVFNTAISNFTGQASLNVNKSSATNSMLPTSSDGKKNWGEDLLDTINTIKIDAITLDDFVEKFNIGAIDILKIDTQGTEYQIIEGATRSIKQNKISLIYMEIIIVSAYQGQKYFDETLLLLRSRGFRLFNLYNFTNSERGELKQLDAIFINDRI